MTDTSSSTPRRTAFWRWLVWSVYFALWTTALLMRNPVSPGDSKQAQVALFYFSKAVHVSAYAVLAGLTAWLRAPRPARWALLAVVSLHTFVAEWLQSVMQNGRIGSPADVLLDHAGIALGVAVTWKWWFGR